MPTWYLRLSLQNNSPGTLCSGDPSTMFFTVIVATTVLCVFSIALEITNVSGSSTRAANLTGVM